MADASLHILIVDDEPNIRKMLAISLEMDGYAVTSVGTAKEALAEAARTAFDLAFVDLRLGANSGLDLIPELLAQSPWMRIVIITAHGSIDSAVETMKRGAADYLTKPFTPAQVKLVTERVAKMRALEQKVAGLESSVGSARAYLTSNSAAMRRVLSTAQQVSRSDATILLRGESGTGKGVLARTIHGWSTRAAKPMNTVSCPAISPQLLESELFGHVRGAFTGAIRDNIGRIAASDGGTLFLDEIGDLPLELQPKLLRFLQDREFERVGEARAHKADVRIIAATNVDLASAVKAGKFREDLLYRVRVMEITLPPLRERPEDIVDLAKFYIDELNPGKPAPELSAETIRMLQSYSWPGNLRELHNVIERALILRQGDELRIEIPGLETDPFKSPALHGDTPPTLEKLEELHIMHVLANSKSLEEAAKTLGINVATLWRKRKRYGI